ncbi:MAG: transposase, partial [Anaerolineales bacterium]
MALYQMLACCLAGMMLAELARVYGGGVARGPSKPKPKRKPAAGKAKSVQRPKPTRAELEAQVRAMFPAPPAPDERSRARAAAVAALKKSVRGIFCLLLLIEYLTGRGATVYTDGYNIYNFLRRSGYQHATVNHSAGEYARGEVHVNTVEGWWSLLRDHLRIHRGVSKVYLPLYVMRFEFLANHRGQTRWAQMLALGSLACQADGQRLRRLV